MPASPNGRAICAIDVQTNITTPPRMPASRILISNEGEGCPTSLEVKFIQLSVAAYRRQSCSQEGYGAPRMTNAIGLCRVSTDHLESRREKRNRAVDCRQV